MRTACNPAIVPSAGATKTSSIQYETKSAQAAGSNIPVAKKPTDKEVG